MSTEIVRTQGTTINDKILYARALSDSVLLPRHYQKNPANLLFALEYADALGVSPIHAITSIHVIEGKPSASADLIGSLVRKAGHKLRVTGDDTHAIAVIIRADDPGFEFRAEWTMDKARAAGLTGKGVWKNYPGAMLRSRAITEVARMAAPDALYGVQYTPEELGASVNADGEPIDLGERPTQQPAPKAEPKPRKTGAEKLAAALPTPEVDWIAELEATGGDVDLIRGLWKRASETGAEAWVLDAIKQAGTDAAASSTVTEILDAEPIEDASA